MFTDYVQRSTHGYPRYVLMGRRTTEPEVLFLKMFEKEFHPQNVHYENVVIMGARRNCHREGGQAQKDPHKDKEGPITRLT